MKRRQFINKSVVAAAGIMGINTFGFSPWAHAAPANRKKMIVIFLRGGADVLSIFPPRVANPQAHPLLPYRGSTVASQHAFLFNARVGGVNTKRALDLGNYPFLFHPEFAGNENIFQGQDIAIWLHSGSRNETRSHFEQMDIMESGSHRGKTATGYLARASHFLQRQSRGAIVLGEVAPYSMRGFEAALINKSADAQGRFHIGGAANPLVDGRALTREDRLALFAYNETCAAAGYRVCEIADSAKATYKQIERDLAGTFQESNVFLHQCELAAKLAKATVNPPIMTIDFQGWDTHFMQTPTESGTSFSRNVKALGDGLKLLKQSLGAEWNNTVVAVMSEFGRTVVANSSFGTDHGRGGAMILMGGPVRRNHNSKTVGGWDLSSLEGTGGSRALKVKVDFRELMGEVLRDHMGVPLTASVVDATVDTKVQTVFDALAPFPKRNVIG